VVLFSTQPLTLTPHRFTTDVERFSQNRLLRVYKLLPFSHHLLKRFTGPNGQVAKITLCATGIATQLLARLTPGLWRQQQCRYCTECGTAQECQDNSC
jgi:hypothetical protein